MKEQSLQYLYNDDDDILSIYHPRIKEVEFVEVSDFIDIGISEQGEICSLEISDASNFFKTVNKKINKDFLQDLKLVKMRQAFYRGVFIVVLMLSTSEGEKVEQSLPPLFQFEYESPLVRSAVP